MYLGPVGRNATELCFDVRTLFVLILWVKLNSKLWPSIKLFN